MVSPTAITKRGMSHCGSLSNERRSVPLAQNQLVASRRKITTSRPMMSVCIRCIRAELAAAAFSSRLGILMADDNSPAFDRRPWGSFTVLDEGEHYKVKRIEVLPGKR